jgi:hypothetical protein
MNFAGKVVLVTGASSGIGRQASIDFAKAGAQTVIIVARSRERLTNLATEISEQEKRCQVIQHVCDVSSKEQVAAMGKSTLDKFGRVDVLVNNAGFGVFGQVKDQTIEQIESVMATNYLGMVYCTKAFLDSMIVRGSGHIVNVASLAASFGVAGLAGYSASKYAMLGFSEALHHELHGTGVGVTVVSPIAVKTDFFNNESFKGRNPNYTYYSLDPHNVSKAVLRAANSPRLEIIVPFYMRAAVWFKHTLPFMVQPISGILFRSRLT